MIDKVTRTLGLIVALALHAGCGSSGGVDGAGGRGGVGPDAEGLEMCCVLGAVCHRTGGGAPDAVADCHDLGHESDPARCREAYDDCLAACGANGAGGAGGDPIRHACVE